MHNIGAVQATHTLQSHQPQRSLLPIGVLSWQLDTRTVVTSPSSSHCQLKTEHHSTLKSLTRCQSAHKKVTLTFIHKIFFGKRQKKPQENRMCFHSLFLLCIVYLFKIVKEIVFVSRCTWNFFNYIHLHGKHVTSGIDLPQLFISTKKNYLVIQELKICFLGLTLFWWDTSISLMFFFGMTAFTLRFILKKRHCTNLCLYKAFHNSQNSLFKFVFCD